MEAQVPVDAQATADILTCILHIGSTTNELIHKFDQNKWEHTQRAALSRLKRLNISKYHTVCQRVNDAPRNAPESWGYHSSCYKNFSATKMIALDDDGEIKSNNVPISRQNRPLRSTLGDEMTRNLSSTGVFPRTCLFCNNIRARERKGGKKVNAKRCATKKASDSVKKAAITLNDTVILVKTENIEIHVKEVRYHERCKRKYLTKAKIKEDSSSPRMAEKTIYSDLRERHDNAFLKLSDHINAFIIDQKQPESLKSLHEKYKVYFLESGEEDSTYTAQNLSRKLLSNYKDKLGIMNVSKKKGRSEAYSSDSRVQNQ